MPVKIPSVRRADSLYAKLGGWTSIEAISHEFLRRLLADPDLAPTPAIMSPEVFTKWLACDLSHALGGPRKSMNYPCRFLDAYPSSAMTRRASIEAHLLAALRTLRVPGMLAEEVVAVFAPADAETDMHVNPAATPQKGIKAMSKSINSSVSILDDDVAVGSALDQKQFAEYAAEIAALRKSMAVNEYDMNGTILDVSDKFERLLGCRRDDVVGKNQSIFVDEATLHSDSFRDTWTKLRRGEAVDGEAKRLTKDGREVWLRYSYNPILDS